MLSLRDKLVAGIRGGRHPAAISLAVVLGLVAGFASGVNLTFALLLWLALVLNVRTTVFLATWFVGLVLALTLHSVCEGAGYALLDELRIGNLLGAVSDSPILALMDWDRYALIGGMAIALVLAVPAARGAWTIADVRWRAQHEGKPPRGKLFRPLALISAPIAAVPLILLPWTIVERQLADELLSEALEFTDLQATAVRTELCLWTGVWSAEHVTVCDRANGYETVLTVKRIDAQLQPAGLLRGWLHVGELRLEGVERGSDSAVHVELATTKTAPAETPSPVVTCDGALNLSHYLAGWSQHPERLSWVSTLLSTLDRLALHDHQRRVVDAQLIGTLGVRPDQPRSRLGRRQARVTIDELAVHELSSNWSLGQKAKLELHHLTSNPRLAVHPSQLKIVAPEWAVEATVELNLHEPGQRHALQLRATDLPIAELLEPTETSTRLVVHRGLISAQGTGWIDVHRVYLPVMLDSQQLSATLRSTTPLANLSADTWNRGLQELAGLRAEALVDGRWSELRMSIEPRELVKQFQHQLRSAGAHELLALIDQDQSQATSRTTAQASAALLSQPAMTQTVTTSPAPTVTPQLDVPPPSVTSPVVQPTAIAEAPPAFTPPAPVPGMVEPAASTTVATTTPLPVSPYPTTNFGPATFEQAPLAPPTETSPVSPGVAVSPSPAPVTPPQSVLPEPSITPATSGAAASNSTKDNPYLDDPIRVMPQQVTDRGTSTPAVASTSRTVEELLAHQAALRAAQSNSEPAVSNTPSNEPTYGHSVANAGDMTLAQTATARQAILSRVTVTDPSVAVAAPAAVANDTPQVAAPGPINMTLGSDLQGLPPRTATRPAATTVSRSTTVAGTNSISNATVASANSATVGVLAKGPNAARPNGVSPAESSPGETSSSWKITSIPRDIANKVTSVFSGKSKKKTATEEAIDAINKRGPHAQRVEEYAQDTATVRRSTAQISSPGSLETGSAVIPEATSSPTKAPATKGATASDPPAEKRSLTRSLFPSWR